ncbi:unnamed protein product [Leptosia nina]|uniref:Uncharacterized protein n=1 Tax=Leptosia nina TaxID=320188 RepID=A0AAV1JHA5_9NEOP
MDRCRCEEYEEAVKKLRFYTVGTLRPDIIDNYDRTGFITTWIQHGVDYVDMKFSKPKAYKVLDPSELPLNKMPPAVRKVEQMWCPYLITKRKWGRRVRSPHYQKLRVRVIHIRDNRRGQLNRSAMEESRSGGTAFMITVSPTPGKYDCTNPSKLLIHPQGYCHSAIKNEYSAIS